MHALMVLFQKKHITKSLSHERQTKRIDAKQNNQRKEKQLNHVLKSSKIKSKQMKAAFSKFQIGAPLFL